MLRPQTFFEKYIKHPIEALGAGMVWTVFRLLPLSLASTIAGRLARLIGPNLSLSTRARSNLSRAMPELKTDEIERILRGMWENLGRTIGEFPHVKNLTFDGSDPRVTVKGLESLRDVMTGDKPCLFYSAHLGNWELTALAAVKNGFEGAFIYREANNPLVQKLYLQGRSDLEGNLFKKGEESVRGIMRAMRANEFVGLLVDQKMNDGIAVPFFGMDAMTAPALGMMALRYKCPVVGARVIRKEDASFEIEILPPIYIDETGDQSADVLRFMTHVNATLEGWIREHPDQWLWLHNRWPKNPET